MIRRSREDRRIHRTAGAAVAALLGAIAQPAAAQVSSQGKGLLTLEIGQGSAPVGGIATQVANPAAPTASSQVHATSFRFMAGYQFAPNVSFDVGVSHFGTMSSSAPYNGTDTLNANVTLSIVEADLVGHFPLTERLRFNVDGGIIESALHSTLSTRLGSVLPSGETGDDNVRRLGATVGTEIEWRFGVVTSVIAGYHLYTHVGSPTLRDSASGTPHVIVLGLHVEF